MTALLMMLDRLLLVTVVVDRVDTAVEVVLVEARVDRCAALGGASEERSRDLRAVGAHRDRERGVARVDGDRGELDDVPTRVDPRRAAC